MHEEVWDAVYTHKTRELERCGKVDKGSGVRYCREVKEKETGLGEVKGAERSRQ